MDFKLKQGGRASMDFIADLAAAVGPLRPRVAAEMARQGLDESSLDADLDTRVRQVDAAMKDSSTFGAFSALMEWSSVQHGILATAAFEEQRAEIEPRLRALQAKGPSTLEAHPDAKLAPYAEGVWIHRTTGGWDGHEFQGFIHGELIHRDYVAKVFPGNIFAQRRQVLDELPRRDYARILEIGTGAGHYTTQIQAAFPNAEICGCDVSLRMLEQAQRVANERGWPWKLFHVAGEATGFAAESFDLVTSYIVMHEVPSEVTRAHMREAFRVLRPGGDLLFTDVTRYAALDKLGVFWAEYGAVNGGEPFWRDAASLDLKEAAEAAGFVNVRSYGLGGRTYPWLVYGHKPSRPTPS